MNYRYLGQFESKGALEPVEPYLDASDACRPMRSIPRR